MMSYIKPFLSFISIPIHPLLACTVSLMCGIIWATSGFSFTLAGAYFISISCIIIYALFSHTDYWRLACWMMVAVTLFGYGAYSTQRMITRHTQKLSQLAEKPIDIIGQVISIEKHHHPFYIFAIILKHKDFTLHIFAHDKGAIKSGDTICIKNVLIRSNQGDYQKYLIKEGVIASVFLATPTYEILRRPTWSYIRTLQETKDRIYLSIKRKLSRITSSLYCSIFLGKKIKDDTKTYISSTFSYWGIIHYLARSGLHVALIVFLWAYALRFIPVGYFIKQFILALLIILYNLLTYTSISFERAYITFLLYKLCNVQKVPIHTVHIITITSCLVLLANPLQLFYLDFQLSFGLTFALALFNEVNKQAKIFAYKTVA